MTYSYIDPRTVAAHGRNTGDRDPVMLLMFYRGGALYLRGTGRTARQNTTHIRMANCSLHPKRRQALQLDPLLSRMERFFGLNETAPSCVRTGRSHWICRGESGKRARVESGPSLSSHSAAISSLYRGLPMFHRRPVD